MSVLDPALAWDVRVRCIYLFIILDPDLTNSLADYSAHHRPHPSPNVLHRRALPPRMHLSSTCPEHSASPRPAAMVTTTRASKARTQVNSMGLFRVLTDADRRDCRRDCRPAAARMPLDALRCNERMWCVRSADRQPRLISSTGFARDAYRTLGTQSIGNCELQPDKMLSQSPDNCL